jgi:hypothetical protein
MAYALTKEQWLDMTDTIPAFGLKIKHKEGRRKLFTTILFSDSFELWQSEELEVIIELWDSDVKEGDTIEIIDYLSLPLLPGLVDPDR